METGRDRSTLIRSGAFGIFQTVRVSRPAQSAHRCAGPVAYAGGRVYLATYGDPPDPPATTAFITALHHAVQQTRPGEPAPNK